VCRNTVGYILREPVRDVRVAVIIGNRIRLSVENPQPPPRASNVSRSDGDDVPVMYMVAVPYVLGGRYSAADD